MAFSKQSGGGGSVPTPVQAANTYLAGPASGSPATPTYRGLVAADIGGAVVNAEWYKYLAYTDDPGSCSSFTPAGGVVYLSKVVFAVATVISNIDIFLRTAGVGATALANCFLGLYDSGGTRRFTSGDLSTDWASGVSVAHTAAIAGGYTAVAGIYYPALIVGTQSTTAMQTIARTAASTNLTWRTNLTAATDRGASNGSSLTALPTSLVLANNANQPPLWFGFR